jgi:uroporphyrinogen III methyltransferase / synthase
VAEPTRNALEGKRVLITRPAAQSAGLFEHLRARGAEPVSLPLIHIHAVQDYSPLDAALLSLRPEDWILFTSQNAVAPVMNRAQAVRNDLFASTSGVRVAAVGPATERALRSSGVSIAFTARIPNGVSLTEELGERLRGKRVLLPRSDIANAALPDAIGQFGGEALEIVVYHTQPALEVAAECRAIIGARRVDAIICFSPSSVQSLEQILAPSRLTDLQDAIIFVAIGGTTASALYESGLHHPLVAADATPEAAATVLHNYFVGRSSSTRRDLAGVNTEANNR